MREYQKVAALVVMVFCSAALLAQMEGAQPTAEQRLQQLATKLNLTEDQKAKIKPMIEDEVKQLQGVRADTSMSQQDKMAKAKEIHSSTMSQVRPLLTPDQQKQLDQMRSQAKERMEQHGQAPPQ